MKTERKLRNCNWFSALMKVSRHHQIDCDCDHDECKHYRHDCVGSVELVSIL